MTLRYNYVVALLQAFVRRKAAAAFYFSSASCREMESKRGTNIDEVVAVDPFVIAIRYPCCPLPVHFNTSSLLGVPHHI